MTEADEKLFLDFVRGTGDVIVLPYTFPRSTPDHVGELPAYFVGTT